MRVKEGYIYVLGLCLGLRLATTLVVAPWRSETEFALISFGDAWFYHHMAINLLRGEGYTVPAYQVLPGMLQRAYPSEHEALWPPGYSAFLATLYALFGVRLTPVLLAQGVLSTVGCWFLMRAAEAIGGRRAGLWAGGLYAVEPTSILCANRLVSESIFAPLLCLCVFLLSQALMAADVRRRLVVLMGLGVALGAATWARVNAIPIAGVLALMLGIVYWHNTRCLRQVATATLIIIGVYLITLAPWHWRNYRLFGVWAFSTAADFNLLSGSDYLHQPEGTLYRKAYQAARAAGEDPRRLNPFQRARYWRQTALNEWRNAPGYYFRRHLERMVIVVTNPGITHWGIILRIEMPRDKGAVRDVWTTRSIWQAGREYLSRLNGALWLIIPYTFAYLAIYYGILIACVVRWRTAFVNLNDSRFAIIMALIAFINLATNIVNIDPRMRLPIMVFLTPALAVGLTNLLRHRRRAADNHSCRVPHG